MTTHIFEWIVVIDLALLSSAIWYVADLLKQIRCEVEEINEAMSKEEPSEDEPLQAR